MAEKKKKNFRDVTGIKFADLIMPLVLGGVGSYSQSAGRGVNLGLQAFRTLQAGREYEDERDAGRGVTAAIENQIKDLEDERNTIQQGITREDPRMTAREGFYGEGGVTTPDPDAEGEMARGEDVDPLTGKGAPKFADRFSLRPEALTPQGPPESFHPGGSQFIQQTEVIPAEAQQFTAGIMARKQASQDSAERLGFVNRQIRLHEQLAALGQVNPGSASYLSSMNALQNEKQMGTMKYAREVHELDAQGRVQKLQLAKEKMQFARDKEAEILAIREAGNKYQIFQNGNNIISVEKANPSNIRINKIPADQETVKNMPFEDKWAPYQDAFKNWTDIATKVEDRIFPSDHEIVDAAWQRYQYWSSVVTLEDEQKFYEMYGQALPKGPPRPGIGSGSGGASPFLLQ